MIADYVHSNENDLDSPGYEYLRSYQAMDNLYKKLLALNYRKDFCQLYKCPAIHQYYFSTPAKNPNEQVLLFACLCAWLIKHKCQMNLELNPEEYEDLDYTIGIILEAVRLLMSSENPKANSREPYQFPPGRLRQGFGPEVIWTLNILADRALELMLESSPQNTKVEIIYCNRSNSDGGINRLPATNSIVIGQPVVGGGLTTRPIGSYQVDDDALVFDGGQENVSGVGSELVQAKENSDVLISDWPLKVEKMIPLLESIKLNEASNRSVDWKEHLMMIDNIRNVTGHFVMQHKPLFETMTSRIKEQMQIISQDEERLQSQLKTEIGAFLKVWRNYSFQFEKNKSLSDMIDLKTKKFADHNVTLKQIDNRIEVRIKELNDGSELKELQSMTERLQKEAADYDAKIGLLLTVYAKIHSKVVASS